MATRRNHTDRATQEIPEVQIAAGKNDDAVELRRSGPSYVEAKTHDLIDFSEVYTVDMKKSPMYQFKEALTRGSLKMDFGDGKKVECKLGGVDFYLKDVRGERFKESLDVNSARRVFVEGKDVEVFTPKFQEVLLKKYEEAERDRNFAILEGFGADYDGYNGRDSLNVQFKPLGNGPLNQQLYLSYQWDMLAKAFEAVNHNPYARRVIDILTDFILGRGYSINFRDSNLQEMWDTNSDELDLDDRLDIWVRDLERQGELFLQPIFDSAGNMSDIINIEASTIWQVMHDPENVNVVLGYWQQYQTPIQLFGPGGEAPEFKYIIRTFSPDEIIHVMINQSGSEARGRSTLFPALEYLKMAHDYMAASTNKAIASACMIFDWSIEGSPTDVQTFAASVPPVNYKKPIASVYHSANAKLSAVQTTETRGRDNGLENIINAIAVATGIGKEYLGASGNTTRAGALTGTEPAVKHFQQRQRVLTRLFELITGKWVAQKLEVGAIDPTTVLSAKDKINKAIASLRAVKLGDAISTIYSALNGSKIEVPLDTSIHVKFPEIVKGDITQTLQNIAYMQSMGWWSPERSAVAATQEWGGIDNYDYTDEQSQIVAGGVKPITATLQQVPMVDPANPTVDPLLPVAAGASTSTPDKTPDKPKPKVLNGTSGNTDVNGRARNNPAGLGATSLRKAMSQASRFKLIRHILGG